MLTMVSSVWTVLLLALALGATGYSLIALYATIRFRRRAPQGAYAYTPPVSVLKPLCGVDRELEENLESFCRQNYPSYEILFSVRSETDAAVPIVRRLERTFPSLPIRLLVIGPPKYLNAKVHGLEEMAKAAQHEILVISDSDVRVGQEYLRSVVAPLADPAVGMSTCLSRCVPGKLRLVVDGSVGDQHAVSSRSAFRVASHGHGILAGPYDGDSQANRQWDRWIRRFGGLPGGRFCFRRVHCQKRASGSLSENIPDHLFRGESLRESLAHRLRWERSSRCSRPAGLHWPDLYARPASGAAGLGLCSGGKSLCTGHSRQLRGRPRASGLADGMAPVARPCLRNYWWLLPAEDFLSFGIWCWAFLGNEIIWRGERFRVLKGGKLSSVAEPKRSKQVQNQLPDAQ